MAQFFLLASQYFKPLAHGPHFQLLLAQCLALLAHRFQPRLSNAQLLLFSRDCVLQPLQLQLPLLHGPLLLRIASLQLLDIGACRLLFKPDSFLNRSSALLHFSHFLAEPPSLFIYTPELLAALLHCLLSPSSLLLQRSQCALHALHRCS